MRPTPRASGSGWTLILLLLVGCANTPELDEQRFKHSLGPGAQPWTHDRFDAPAGRFRFAVHSDLTGGEREGVYAIAIEQLNLLRPEFIINVGDLIEGDPDRAVVDEQWDHFEARAARARAPVFHVGGNHDLLGTALREAWDDRHGPRYYHFVYGNALFLVLDSDDHTPARLQEIAQLRQEALALVQEQGWGAFSETAYAQLPENAAGQISVEQSRYFQAVLAANDQVQWTFLFLHKAPWLRPDLEAWSDIEAALAGRSYTVFHGHEHTYAHQRRHGADYIRLATTGGVQLPDSGRSMDHVVLVTVDENGVDIANLLMEGILDRHGRVPLNGDSVCFESTRCDPPPED